jgi:hypothetical protein
MLSTLIALTSFAVADTPAETPAVTPDTSAETEAEVPAAQDGPAASPGIINADFNVTMVTVDGGKVSAHVKRIERGENTYADSWTTADKAMGFYVEGNGEYKKIKWDDVKKVVVSVPNAKDFNCLYSSDYSPWMYECSLKLKSTITTKNGKSYAADTGHKWKFVTDDNAEHTFWLKKHYARQQDEKVVDLEVTNPENYALYGALQAQLRNEIKSSLIKSIVVQ